MLDSFELLEETKKPLLSFKGFFEPSQFLNIQINTDIKKTKTIITIPNSYLNNLLIRKGEIYLFGAYFSPLSSVSTHISPDPTRTRKLLLHSEEISKLIGGVERKGFTLVPLSLNWRKGRAKLKLALAKGKKQHDKRASIKQREWDREQHRIDKMNRR